MAPEEYAGLVPCFSKAESKIWDQQVKNWGFQRMLNISMSPLDPAFLMIFLMIDRILGILRPFKLTLEEHNGTNGTWISRSSVHRTTTKKCDVTASLQIAIHNARYQVVRKIAWFANWDSKYLIWLLEENRSKMTQHFPLNPGDTNAQYRKTHFKKRKIFSAWHFLLFSQSCHIGDYRGGIDYICRACDSQRPGKCSRYRLSKSTIWVHWENRLKCHIEKIFRTPWT